MMAGESLARGDEAYSIQASSLKRLFLWKALQIAREALSHVAEFAILGLIAVLIYGWAYLPRLAKAGAGLSPWAALLLPYACAFLGLVGLVCAARPLAQGGRTFYAVSGLSLLEEFRLARVSFTLRNAWMAILVFLALLPLGLIGPGGLTRSLLLALFCICCYALAAPLAFDLKIGKGRGPRLASVSSPSPSLGAAWPGSARRALRLASYEAFASSLEGPRAKPRPWLGLRAALFLESLRRDSSALIVLGMALLLEIAALIDISAWDRADPTQVALIASRGRAILFFCSSLASLAFLQIRAQAPRAFYRSLPLSFIVYVRENLPYLLLAGLLVALPLLLPLAFLYPSDLGWNLAALLLIDIASAAIGEIRPYRLSLVSIGLVLCSTVLAFLSLTSRLSPLLVLLLLACGLGALARDRFYHAEVYE